MNKKTLKGRVCRNQVKNSYSKYVVWLDHEPEDPLTETKGRKQNFLFLPKALEPEIDKVRIARDADPKYICRVSLCLDEKDIKGKKGNLIYINRDLRPSQLRIYGVEYSAEGSDRHIVATMQDYIEILEKEVTEYTDDVYSEVSKKLNYSELTPEWDPAERYAVDKELELYTFRMAYGYTSVYYAMCEKFFETIFKKLGKDEKINLHILSIGCGIKTDAQGMKYAMYEYEDRIAKTKYVGIDPGEWNRSKFMLHLNGDDEYVKVDDISQEIEYIDAIEYRESLEAIDDGTATPVYVIVFPNSISEFIDLEEFGNLLDKLLQVYAGKEHYILCSRNPEKKSLHDEDRQGTRIDEKQIEEIKRRTGEAIYSKLDAENTPINDKYGNILGYAGDTLRRFNQEILSRSRDGRCAITTTKYENYEIFAP